MADDDIKHHGLTEQRIAHIMDLMRDWKWRRGKTGKELAAEWGLSVNRVEQLSAEASKRVRAEVTDPDRVSMTVGTALAKVLDDAMQDDDRKIVIDSAKAWAQIVGAMAPQRHEVATSAATPQQAAAMVREAFGRVTPGDDVPASEDSERGDSSE